LKTSDVCKECNCGSKPAIKGIGSSNPKVVFIGDLPSIDDMRKGTPYTGLPGKIMQGILDTVGIGDEDAYFTTLFKCWLEAGRQPSAAEAKKCMPILEQELAELKPQYIIALGKLASSRLFPKTSITRDRGVIMESTLGYPGLLTFHPKATIVKGGDTKLPFIISDVKKIWRQLTSDELPEGMTNPETQIFLATTYKETTAILSRLRELPDNTPVSLDWETTGLVPGKDVHFCMGLSWKPGTGVAITAQQVRLYRKDFKKELERFRLTGFNVAVFDYQWSKVLDLHQPFEHDAMLMHYMLDERPQRRSQTNLAVQELDAPDYENDLLIKYDCDKTDFTEKIPMEEIMEYCAKDVDWALRLTILFEKELMKFPTLEKVYHEIMMPGAHVIGDVIQTGLWVHKDKLNEVGQQLEGEIKGLELEMIRLVDKKDFNPRSSVQIQEYLWDELKLQEPKIYQRKDRSANAETIQALLEQYPDHAFLNMLAEYRKKYVYYSRYIKALEDLIDDKGRVHARIHMDRTETGRLSITEPPLHQIPREGVIRTIFGAPPGRVLIQADYSQLEIRVAAHVGKDQRLTELLKTGVDFHTKMASEAFSIPVDEVTYEQRQAAKGVSFGLLYLMSEEKLAANTGLPPAEARQFVKTYKQLMPGVQRAIKETKEQVKQSYVESIFGRRRRFSLITDKNISGLEREAVNFRLGQSPGNDITMSAMIRLHEYLNKYYPEARIVLTVHDSILVECPEALADTIVQSMYKIMEQMPFDTEVPFPVEIKVGTSWGEGEEIKKR